MSKTSLITGITGQDGAYLARLLLDKQEWELIGRIFSREFLKKNSRRIEKKLTAILNTAGARSSDLGLSRNNRELSLSFRNVIRDNERIGATVVVNDLITTCMLIPVARLTTVNKPAPRLLN